MRRRALVATSLLVATLALAGCKSNAETVSENLSKEAEQFEVQRRIVGINGITDKELFLVEGKCSISREADALVVTCKHADDDFRKHYVGKADNMIWISTQLDGLDVSEYHTKIVLKPESLIPDFDLETS